MGPSASAPPCPDLPDTSGHRAKQPGAGRPWQPPMTSSFFACLPPSARCYFLPDAHPSSPHFSPRVGMPSRPRSRPHRTPEAELPSCVLAPALLSWGTFLPQGQGPLVPQPQHLPRPPGRAGRALLCSLPPPLPSLPGSVQPVRSCWTLIPGAQPPVLLNHSGSSCRGPGHSCRVMQDQQTPSHPSEAGTHSGPRVLQLYRVLKK